MKVNETRLIFKTITFLKDIQDNIFITVKRPPVKQSVRQQIKITITLNKTSGKGVIILQ